MVLNVGLKHIKSLNTGFWTSPETLARAFHDTYEALAPSHGYSTREASRKPWEEVPSQNKSLMVAVAEHLLNHFPAQEIVDQSQIWPMQTELQAFEQKPDPSLARIASSIEAIERHLTKAPRQPMSTSARTEVIVKQLESLDILAEGLHLVPILSQAMEYSGASDIQRFFHHAGQLADLQGTTLVQALEHLLVELPQAEPAMPTLEELQRQLAEVTAERDKLQTQIKDLAKPKTELDALIRGENPYGLSEDADD